MARGRKAATVARGSVFVLAADMRTAEKWAAAVGLSKDRYRYAVNTAVFDVLGPHDSYGFVAGFERAGSRHTEIMGLVRRLDIPWCERDPYALVRGEDGTVDTGLLVDPWPPDAGVPA
jgi:hypothetical protein